MRAWHFTEMPYPDIPPFDQLKNTRVTIPNRLFDPKIGADLYNRYLDEHCIADELGLDIMLNEHHSSASCIDSCVPLPAAILARQTRNARILILGNPVANRGEPVRIAEEMAMIDCISRGRLDVGFVRGVPTEINPANSNPTMTNERLWEGIDLAMRAWTTHDGPFNYEGRFWHKRAVNIWPRPYQQPHPPVWITGSSDRENVRKVAQHGFTFATFLQPYENTRSLFDEYRKHYVDAGVPHQGGTAFLPLVYTADSDSEAEKGAQELLWYIRSNKTEPQFKNPPGYASIALNVAGAAGQVRRPHRGGARAGPRLHDGAGHPRRRHARQGRGAHPEILRPGRRLRSPDDDAAGRAPRSQAHGPQHDLVRQGGVSADQGSAADGGVKGSRGARAGEVR